MSDDLNLLRQYAGSVAAATAGIVSAKLCVLLAAGIAAAAAVGVVVVVKSTDPKTELSQVQIPEPVVVAEGDEKKQTGDEAGATSARDEPWGNKIISFGFVKTPLPEAVALVREKTGANIMLDKEGLPEDGEITLEVKDIKLLRALDWISAQAGLMYVTRGDGSVLLATAERMLQLEERVTRLYDVGDLLDPPKDERQSHIITPESLVAFIKLDVAPTTWREEYGTSITCRNQKLTVVHIEKVQEQVRRSLGRIGWIGWKEEPEDTPAEVADDDPFGGKKVTFDFVETPFTEVVAFVTEKTGVNIVLDEEVLPENREVTLKVGDMEASIALDWICEALDLHRGSKEDGSVVVTTRPRVLQLRGMFTRVYNVADLLNPDGLPKWYTPLTPESLMKFITNTIAPGTWGEETATLIKCENGKLTVVHAEKVHEKVRRLLEAHHWVERMRRAGIKEAVPKFTPPPEDPRKKKLAGKTTTFSTKEAPLPDLVAFLRETTEVNIILDQERVPPGLQATLKVYEMELSTALDKICSVCRLEYLVRDDGSVLITTPEQVFQLEQSRVKIYNVEYLLEKPPRRLQNHPEGPAAAIVDLIKQTIAPGTWGEEYRTSIRHHNGRLIVVHVPGTHFHVLKLLHSLSGNQKADTTE